MALPAAAIALLLLLAPLGTAGEEPLGHPSFTPSPERPIGWRGDGSGRYPGATPTPVFNGLTGAGILWKVDTPNLSSGSPIVVGSRVICTAEPHTVLCYDAKTGAKLWHNATDQLDLLCPGAEAKRLRRQFHLANRVCEGSLKLAEAPELSGVMTGTREEGKQLLPMLTPKDHFSSRGLWFQAYSDSIGRTFATPVSDGRRVWVSFGSHSVQCYDLETGATVWNVFHGPTKGVASVMDTEWFAPSPLLVGGLLIATQNGTVRGLDAATGALRWAVDIGDHAATANSSIGHCGVGTPLALDLSGTKVIVTPGGRVIRVADGQVLSADLGARADIGGHSPIADDERDQVWFFDYQAGGRGKASGRSTLLALTLAGDRVSARTLWQQEKQPFIFMGSPILWRGSILDDKQTPFDAQTGAKRSFQSVQGGAFKGLGFDSQCSPIVVGDTLVGYASKGSLIFADLALAGQGASKVVECPLWQGSERKGDPSARQAVREAIIARARQAWEAGIIGYVPRMPNHGDYDDMYGSSPCAVGTRLYIRTRAALWCVGR
jgi:outer membrane protein assembly factor BamB